MAHYFGAHSAPWYVAQAVRSSKYFISDVQAADVVFVYDYCFYTWWLAWVHSYGRPSGVASPGDSLLLGRKVTCGIYPCQKLRFSHSRS